MKNINPISSEELANRAAMQARPFVPGDVIDFCGDRFRVRNNYGTTGTVEYLDGSISISPFYWTFEDCTAQLIEETKH